MTKTQCKRLRGSLTRLKVGRSRVLRTALNSKATKAYEEFADAALELYQLLDELDIEAIESIRSSPT